MGEHGDKNGKRWVRVEGANRGAGVDGMGGKKEAWRDRGNPRTVFLGLGEGHVLVA